MLSSIKIQYLENYDFESWGPLSFATEGSAGFDLRATEDLIVEPGSTKLIKCGIKTEFNNKYAMLVLPRSGLALKNKITVMNAPGLIDSDYRGEIGVILYNGDLSAPMLPGFKVERGMRVAQAIIIKVENPHLQSVNEDGLSTTERGSGGFGSSGVK